MTKSDIVLEFANNPEIQKAFDTADFETTRLKAIETAKVLEHLAARETEYDKPKCMPMTLAQISKKLDLSLAVLARNISIFDFGLVRLLEHKGVSKEVVHTAMAHNLDGFKLKFSMIKAEAAAREAAEAMEQEKAKAVRGN